MKQYDSVFSLTGYGPEVIEYLSELPGPRSLDDLDFSIQEVEDAINNLDNNSSPGPDGVPTTLLKNCTTSISKPLQLLWRKSLDRGEIPHSLKFGIVIPIYKGGDRCLPKNFRPVTLTSHIIKIFERILMRRIVAFLDQANLFNKHQHGFRKGRSCLSQLLEHFQNILLGMELGVEVDVVYLDFFKAFDQVDHKTVLEKLSAIGISGKLLTWIGTFLIGRRHAVIVDGVLSDTGHVRSGVPQGSVLCCF